MASADQDRRRSPAVVMMNALQRSRVRDLAVGDQADDLPRIRVHAETPCAVDRGSDSAGSSASGSAAPVTTCRNRSVSGGAVPAELAHRPGRQRGPQHGLVVGAVGELQHSAVALGTPARRRRADPSRTSRRARAATSTTSVSAPPARSSSTVPHGDHPPGRGRCRPGRRAARPGRAGGWRRSPVRRRRPCRAAPRSSRRRRPGRARRTARRAPGCRGSCTSAAASCTRCWLPRLSFCTSSPRRPATPSRSVHSSIARRGRRRPIIPCSRAR